MKQKIHDALIHYIQKSGNFHIGRNIAIDETVVGLPLFEDPLIGVCSAQDEWFWAFKCEDVVGSHHLLPEDWQNGACRVVSVFLPFSNEVCQSNRGGDWPSAAWLHARYEGQQHINEMAAYLCAYMEEMGYKTVAPSLDKRFRIGHKGYPFTSNWSERHVAFACNLGTFSLSKGLITKKGVAGRFFSVVTNAPVSIDARQTRGYMEACSLCGACIKACPSNAITFDGGKDHAVCSAFLQTVRKQSKPRYGCGKCQAGMPCEAGEPALYPNGIDKNKENP